MNKKYISTDDWRSNRVNAIPKVVSTHFVVFFSGDGDNGDTDGGSDGDDGASDCDHGGHGGDHVIHLICCFYLCWWR